MCYSFAVLKKKSLFMLREKSRSISFLILKEHNLDMN